MHEVEGFWAGAQALWPRIDVPALADKAGSLEALKDHSAAQLVALGVEAELARLWRNAQPTPSLGRPITLEDPLYPTRFRQRLDLPPPPVVCVEGCADRLNDPVRLGVVGTRRCSPQGTTLAFQLANTLSVAGACIISGLARGIDTHAHLGALATGRTVAVLAHGLAHTAPPQNRRLRHEIIDGGGAVLSTYADCKPPAKHTFPQRNQWIAALSTAFVVVEAPRRSGALITAEFAERLGVPLWAIPGSILADACAGSNDLIAAGVPALTDLDAFAQAIAGARPDSRLPHWTAMLFEGRSFDAIAHATRRSVLHVADDVVRLQMAGRLVRLPNGRYAPTSSCT